MLADDCIRRDCIKGNNGRGTERKRERQREGACVCEGDSVAIETEWQSRVLSPFLVVLSHSKSHGFYSMPGSSSF